MTLYRLARDSKVAELLAEAAENGKDVEVFVELKARFDEENNIEWSRRLESAGCKVIYGIEHIKVHCKLCLLIMEDADGNPRYITQVGTGNYNEKTSRIYTDYCLVTADQTIGTDGMNVFRALTEGGTVQSAEKLLVSPNYMEIPLIELIDNEIKKGNKGRIRLKINSLTDKTLIEKLIEASCSGVRIDLVVRGICCLIPGVRKSTENIRVISIVGRYLEHSRMYLFGEGTETKAYISSADWMTRNMTRRVEIACPITDPHHISLLGRIHDTCMQDDSQSWELRSDGIYYHRKPAEVHSVNAQEAFYDDAFLTDHP
jgi:polyphosphate kinase